MYRVYVTTFLGFGGNMARRRYEDGLLNATLSAAVAADPCLPPGLEDAVLRGNRTLRLRGRGDWARCLDAVRPLLGLRGGGDSLGGVYQVGAGSRGGAGGGGGL